MARPFKIGLFLPTYEGEMDGATARWRDLVAMAKLAEDVGFDSIWVADHLLVRQPERISGPWEAFSLLAGLAAVTERVELGPLVSCVTFRNPALLAKLADTLDEISGGRLILGLGAGWHEPEYRAFGYPFDHRVGRFEEALQIITGLLRDGRVDFAGRYYSARECELRPRGPRANGPPILVGAKGERMLRLTAQYADSWNGFYSTFGNQPEGLAPHIAALDTACAAVGRDPATLERNVSVYLQSAPYVKTADWGVEPLSGTPEELAEALRAYTAYGVTHVQLGLEPQTEAGIAACAPILEALDRG